jgi:hypothetical protein
MKLACVLAVGGVLLLAAGATASGPRAVRFTSLVQAEHESDVKYPQSTTVVNAAVTVARTANEATGLGFLLPQAARAAIDHVNFNRRVAIAAWLTTPSSGYGVTVTRVALARVGKVSQWCVRATVTSPQAGHPRTGYVWTQAHIVTVAVPRPTVGLPNTTRNWVLRDQHGKLLSVSHSEGASMSPGRRLRPTAIARGCPR